MKTTQVISPYLPSREKYKAYVDKIFDAGWLTNNGNLVSELEFRLARYLGVRNLICVANGTLALQLTYKALGLKGEVLTTPFTFAATSSSLVWEGLTPVYADVDRQSFNIDPAKVRALISEKTSAIVPVHVYGNPCEVDEIQTIAKENDLKLIYDAAHAFNVFYESDRQQPKNILNYGHASTISFHATKLFHTIEGGAIVTNDDELAKDLRARVNFGIGENGFITTIGTNLKMNEFEAAMGLCLLDEIEKIISERKRIWTKYAQELTGVVEFQLWNSKSENNYSYAPVLLTDNKKVEQVLKRCAELNIYPRRYFNPSLNKIEIYRSKSNQKVPRPTNSEKLASRVLCLPLYPGLSEHKQEQIIKIITDENICIDR